MCNFCQKQFKTKSHARTHMTDLHFPVPTQCPNCLKVFASRPKMMRHRSKMCKVQGWLPLAGAGAPSPPVDAGTRSSGRKRASEEEELIAVKQEMLIEKATTPKKSRKARGS